MPRISSSTKLAALCLILAVLAGGLWWWFSAPPAAELVRDDAHLMTEAQRAFVARFHDYLLTDHDIDYRVVTGRGFGDINREAVNRFAELGRSQRSKTGRGLLLLIDAEADLVRLEVGYALEGVFPDAFAAYVEHRQMVPFFERARVADGILATTELIVTRAQRAAAHAGFEGEAWATASGGAGATSTARLGAGPRRGSGAAPAPAAPVAAGASPGATLRAYFAAMARRDARSDLAIYTAETRAMLKGWLMTPAQMDNVVRTYQSCHAEAPKISPDGRRAVIRYPPAERACAPFFFEREGGGWALDLTMMQRAIRFGRTNAWHFDQGVDHPYRFAFTDWRFDRKGFPRVR